MKRVIRYLHTAALSAIGAAIPIYLLLISVIMGIAMGVMILLSQLYGANQEDQIKRLFSTMLIFFLFLVVFVGVSGAILARPMLELIKAPNEILNQGTNYLQILFLGVPFTMLYNLAGAAMRSLGDSKEPLYALLISSVINQFGYAALRGTCHRSHRRQRHAGRYERKQLFYCLCMVLSAHGNYVLPGRSAGGRRRHVHRGCPLRCFDCHPAGGNGDLSADDRLFQQSRIDANKSIG